MQEDQFEKFVRDHREEFDSEIPSDKVWAAIDSERSSKTRTIQLFPKTWQRIAASLVLLAGAGLAYFMINSDQGLEANYIPPEVVEMDQFYETQVNEALERLNEYDGVDSNVSMEVSDELATLEREKMRLLEELKNDVNNEQILEELIKTYRMRLEVLEDVLSIIRELNESKELKNDNYNGIST